MAKQTAPLDDAGKAAWRHEVATMLRVLADRIEHEQDLFPVQVECEYDRSLVEGRVSLEQSDELNQMRVGLVFTPS